MAISLAQSDVFQQASRDAIHREYRRISRNWLRGRWLQAQNRYRYDAVSRIARDIRKARAVNSPHLRQYIAASAAIHCADGWSYLGRALDSLLRGDGPTSCHLAYYAELRAAMSLLASEGIGVFNRKHYVVSSNSECVLIPRGDEPTKMGTHGFTWDALEYWAGTDSARDLFFQIIAPGGIALGEWLVAFNIRDLRGALATKWLKEWGIDLRRFAEDRDARNTASYRPTSFADVKAYSPRDTVDQVEELWRVYEPTQSERFYEIDRSLLKTCLLHFFRHAHASRPGGSGASRTFDASIIAMIAQIEPNNRDLWERYLTDRTIAQRKLITEALGNAEIHEPRFASQILARAALLLRLATGSAQRLLPSDYQEGALDFWLDSFGKSHCLWGNDGRPSDLTDLWADIEEALEGMRGLWRSSTEICFRDIWRSQPAAAGSLGTCERIALWGLGL